MKTVEEIYLYVLAQRDKIDAERIKIECNPNCQDLSPLTKIFAKLDAYNDVLRFIKLTKPK